MYLLASEQELKIGSLCCRPPHLLNGWESNPCLVHLTIYQRCWGWAIIGDPSLTPDMPSSPIRGSHSLHLSWQPERVVPWLLFGDVMPFLHLLSYGNLTSSFSCHQTMDSTSLLLGEESINQSAWEREKPREVHPSILGCHHNSFPPMWCPLCKEVDETQNMCVDMSWQWVLSTTQDGDTKKGQWMENVNWNGLGEVEVGREAGHEEGHTVDWKNLVPLLNIIRLHIKDTMTPFIVAYSSIGLTLCLDKYKFFHVFKEENNIINWSICILVQSNHVIFSIRN